MISKNLTTDFLLSRTVWNDNFWWIWVNTKLVEVLMFNLVQENGESGHFSTFYVYFNFNLHYSLALFTIFFELVSKTDSGMSNNTYPNRASLILLILASRRPPSRPLIYGLPPMGCPLWAVAYGCSVGVISLAELIQ